MGENKRLLNIHGQKFAKLVAFQANTNVFKANTNASLKNMDTQVGKLALTMQNQSKGAFPSDTKKNPKDCMVVTLRSGREIENKKEEEKKKTEKEEKEETIKETKLSSSELTEEAMEIFMDDFSVYGYSFEKCLKKIGNNTSEVPRQNLALKKCHFMVAEGIVLGHKISATGLEVD